MGTVPLNHARRFISFQSGCCVCATQNKKRHMIAQENEIEREQRDSKTTPRFGKRATQRDSRTASCYPARGLRAATRTTRAEQAWATAWKLSVSRADWRRQNGTDERIHATSLRR